MSMIQSAYSARSAQGDVICTTVQLSHSLREQLMPGPCLWSERYMKQSERPGRNIMQGVAEGVAGVAV